MQPSTPKKDESVKAGLQIENHHIPETEEELDDLVHQRGDEQPDDSEEHDIDDLVHKQPPVAENNDEEKDPDDLVHQKSS